MLGVEGLLCCDALCCVGSRAEGGGGVGGIYMSACATGGLVARGRSLALLQSRVERGVEVCMRAGSKHCCCGPRLPTRMIPAQ